MDVKKKLRLHIINLKIYKLMSYKHVTEGNYLINLTVIDLTIFYKFFTYFVEIKTWCT